MAYEFQQKQKKGLSSGNGTMLMGKLRDSMGGGKRETFIFLLCGFFAFRMKPRFPIVIVAFQSF